jgi:predicted enzyme related to lactoylglutathione lyase
VAPKNSRTTVALAPVGPTAKPGTDTGIRLSTADAQACHEQLRASGVDVDAEVMRFGEGVPPMFSFRDPDGNRLYIVQES